jgi:aldose 1-epimerase
MATKEPKMTKETWTLYLCILFIILTCVSLSCRQEPAAEQAAAEVEGKRKMDIQQDVFGTMPDGTEVLLFTLTNSQGLKAKIISYGAILVAFEVPDKNGNLEDITLGYGSLEGYLETTPYFGAVVGRYGNRIANGKFSLQGQEYTLATNNGENHLHGGTKGFDKVVWEAEAIKEERAVGVKLNYLSPDGEEGYPGNLACTMVYTLTEDNELKFSYEATTDKATPVNLTQHSYWSLAGQGTSDILGHELMLNADKYTPVDEGLIPTGELRAVSDTPFDFTTPHTIGARIADVPGGYDHNFVLRGGGESLELAARVYEPGSGRVMEIFTDQPGIQFYAGNFLDGTITGKAGKVYHKHYGFCLETQHFPDSPNRAAFPSTILEPGETYRTRTVHKFYTR